MLEWYVEICLKIYGSSIFTSVQKINSLHKSEFYCGLKMV